MIHPGRKFADKLGVNPILEKAYLESLRIFHSTAKVVKPKKPPQAQGEEQKEDDN